MSNSHAPKDTATSTKPEPPSKTPAPPANDDWITAQRPYVKFRAPAGWSTEMTRISAGSSVFAHAGW